MKMVLVYPRLLEALRPQPTTYTVENIIRSLDDEMNAGEGNAEQSEQALESLQRHERYTRATTDTSGRGERRGGNHSRDTSSDSMSRTIWSATPIGGSTCIKRSSHVETPNERAAAATASHQYHTVGTFIKESHTSQRCSSVSWTR